MVRVFYPSSHISEFLACLNKSHIQKATPFCTSVGMYCPPATPGQANLLNNVQIIAFRCPYSSRTIFWSNNLVEITSQNEGEGCVQKRSDLSQ
ncbi:hypothetical protein XELAEV_18024635mg [Xenopus laevis]|uniref:Uncharacterized protein n=1 Tax=Xenopus laevis TaxID=8355 RepID=A0A974CY56_XENLA|nr:hypothetical protein XELAEV_18024635mg [Xenopus laevis]